MNDTFIDVIKWTTLRRYRQNDVIECTTLWRWKLWSKFCCLEQQWSHTSSRRVLEVQLFHFDFPQHPLNTFFKFPFSTWHKCKCTVWQSVAFTRTCVVRFKCEKGYCILHVPNVATLPDDEGQCVHENDDENRDSDDDDYDDVVSWKHHSVWWVSGKDYLMQCP